MRASGSHTVGAVLFWNKAIAILCMVVERALIINIYKRDNVSAPTRSQHVLNGVASSTKQIAVVS